jgi:hypothetical protein
MRILAIACSVFLAAACSKPSTTAPASPASPDPAPVDTTGAATRPTLTAEACAAQGGEVIGAIGDGAIHRPDYVCATGAPPIGSIVAKAGEPVAIEGSVCCKK